MFLNKVFIWTMSKKAFLLEGYVVCFSSVYTAWFPVVIRRVVVILAFAFVCEHNMSLFSTKSDSFFYYPS